MQLYVTGSLCGSTCTSVCTVVATRGDDEAYNIVSYFPLQFLGSSHGDGRYSGSQLFCIPSDHTQTTTRLCVHPLRSLLVRLI
jgi:hypothetical protein